jgi:hypothetical protein
MIALLITLISLALAAVGLFFTGWLHAGVYALFDLAYRYHKKVRRSKRPARIFLIRHGESQANIDGSKYIYVFIQYNLF